MDKNSTLQEYYKKFQSNMDVLTHVGAAYGSHPLLVGMELGDVSMENATQEEVDAAMARADQSFLAIIFLWARIDPDMGFSLKVLRTG